MNRAVRSTAPKMAFAFSGAHKKRLDLSVGSHLAAHRAVRGAVVKGIIATLTAVFVTNGGRLDRFAGALPPMVYLIFAMTLST